MTEAESPKARRKRYAMQKRDAETEERETVHMDGKATKRNRIATIVGLYGIIYLVVRYGVPRLFPVDEWASFALALGVVVAIFVAVTRRRK